MTVLNILGYHGYTVVGMASKGTPVNKYVTLSTLLEKCLVDFAVSDWWRYCKALCDVKCRQNRGKWGWKDIIILTAVKRNCKIWEVSGSDIFKTFLWNYKDKYCFQVILDTGEKIFWVPRWIMKTAGTPASDVLSAIVSPILMRDC